MTDGPQTDGLAMSMTDIMEIDFPKRDWGGWQLTDTWLEYPDPRYELDLCRFTSSARMLDMIMQVAAKTWATDAILAGLVRALEDVLNPQAGLCCGGLDSPGSEATIKQLCQAWQDAVRGKRERAG